jgi:flagellar motor protein MotB
VSDIELDDSDVLNAWPAFVDLLAAMVLIFVVLIAVVIVDARDPGIAIWRQQLVAQLRTSDTTAFSVDTTADELAVRIRFSAEATFPRNRFEFDSLKTDARRALDRLSGILRSDEIMRYTAEVRVIGYTDGVPFSDPTGAFSNWELSAARASAVARYLVTVGRVNPCRVSATGRGSHFPADNGSGDRDLDRSRRIEVWILPANRLTETTLEGTCDPVGDGTPATKVAS